MHWRSSWDQTKVNGQEVENMEGWRRRLIADNRCNGGATMVRFGEEGVLV
jgi:hypothetical protein